MKKDDRQANAARRAERIAKATREEHVMREFIAECQTCLTPKEWNQYYPEAERNAGRTFHIVEFLVSTLVRTQTAMVPRLRKALDDVIDECEIDRDRWDDLPKLNYDSYWRQQYGYDS